MRISRLILLLLLIALSMRIFTAVVAGDKNAKHGDASGYNSYAIAILQNEDWIANPDFYGGSRPV